jgi:hypothetical protein
MRLLHRTYGLKATLRHSLHETVKIGSEIVNFDSLKYF